MKSNSEKFPITHELLVYKWRCKKRVKKEKNCCHAKKCVTAEIFCGIIKL